MTAALTAQISTKIRCNFCQIFLDSDNYLHHCPNNDIGDYLIEKYFDICSQSSVLRFVGSQGLIVSRKLHNFQNQHYLHICLLTFSTKNYLFSAERWWVVKYFSSNPTKIFHPTQLYCVCEGNIWKLIKFWKLELNSVTILLKLWVNDIIHSLPGLIRNLSKLKYCKSLGKVQEFIWICSLAELCCWMRDDDLI